MQTSTAKCAWTAGLSIPRENRFYQFFLQILLLEPIGLKLKPLYLVLSCYRICVFISAVCDGAWKRGVAQTAIVNLLMTSIAILSIMFWQILFHLCLATPAVLNRFLRTK